VQPRKFVASFDVYLMTSVPIEMTPSVANSAVDVTGIVVIAASMSDDRVVLARFAAVSKSVFAANAPG
jgi:hypothetical protein